MPVFIFEDIVSTFDLEKDRKIKSIRVKNMQIELAVDIEC
jgi:hypothetical protein